MKIGKSHIMEDNSEESESENENKPKSDKDSKQQQKRVKYEDISSEGPKRKKKKNDLYKAPTVEELNNLKETENLYNNNLFRLQITELVSEVKIKNKRKLQLKQWLQEFQAVAEKLPEYEDILLSEIKPLGKKKKGKREKFINSLANSYPCPFQTDQDVILKLTKPESVECFGLYDNNCLPGPDLKLCVNVKIPKSMFHTKDFLNNRYLVKRFYYLLYVSEHITAINKKLTYHDSNVLLPVLQLNPTEDDKIIVYIYVTPCQEYFKPSRVLPHMNNMKHDLFDSGIKDIEILKANPSLLYNSALAHDFTLSVNVSEIKSLLNEQENVQEGIKLLYVWLKQRELNTGYGLFNDSLLLHLIAYLISIKKINKYMSSYQVIRIFWNFIASGDIEKNLISFGQIPVDISESFKKSFDLIFLDHTGCYNLMAFLNDDVFKKVKVECEMALKHLDEGGMNSFHALFLTKLPFWLQYDLILDLSESLPLQSQFVSTDVEKSVNIGYNKFFNLTHLTKLLKRGLNNRILNIVPKIEVEYDEEQKFPIKKFFYGINLNPNMAFHFIEMGPALSDHIKADEFRKFWGYLSSDRRFRDGSTNVAVHFKMSTIKGKRGIVKRIIKFLLSEKLDLKFHMYYDEFDETLICKKVVTPYRLGTNEESCLKIITASDELGKKMRSFHMSLSITGIQGLSETFCYTEVFPPIASAIHRGGHVTIVNGKNLIFSDKKIGVIPKFTQPVECVLQLEHSSKWPNDLEGVRHIKTQFYLEISKLLQETHGIISHVTRDYLEVFYEGFVFRYKLFVPKEMAMIKKEYTESGETKYVDTVESMQLERNLDILPKVIAALKGLQSQHPSFGPGTAIIKRWLCSQLIDDHHFPEIVIGLLNASLYLNRTAFGDSSTPQISFLRFLKFFAEFQWMIQTVIVNFNEEIAKEDISDLESKIQENRKSIQPLYIILPFDKGQSLFTKEAPNEQILNRIQLLAQASLKLISNRISEASLFDIKQLFVPNWEGYDLLIHLKPLMNPRQHEHVDDSGDSRIVLEKYGYSKDEKIPIVGFNPVQIYLNVLRKSYGHFATFFHDTYGGNTIGVLWNPNNKDIKDFKVANVNGRKVIEDKLSFNFDALIDDFYVLGKKIVKWIEKVN